MINRRFPPITGEARRFFMVLVDSCVWITARERDNDLFVRLALQGLLDEYQACLCGPVKLEVMGGCRAAKRRQLEYFFDIIPYQPMKEKVWNDAVQLAWRLRDRGCHAPWNDVLISALAIEANLPVYSIDKHFQQISSLSGLMLYQPGYGGSFNDATE